MPTTFTIHNDDPIDHEWLIGDLAPYERRPRWDRAGARVATRRARGPSMSTRTTTLTFPV